MTDVAKRLGGATAAEAALQTLIIFLATVEVVQSSMYAVLTPLLPAFEGEFSLSKAQAGLLVAMFPIGMVLVSPPVGLFAARVGVKRSCLASLFVLAAMNIWFGFAQRFAELLVIRFVQGAAGALCWSAAFAWLVEVAPRQRRGEMIGVLAGASAAGAMLGPAVGGTAVMLGRSEAFCGVAAVALLLVAIGGRYREPLTGPIPSFASIRLAHRSRRVLGVLWLVAVPGLVLGMLLVLAPLQLSRLGWGGGWIAGTYLVAAFIGVIARPAIGRWSDRRGRLVAIRILLGGATPAVLAIPWLTRPWLVAPLVVCAVSAYGATWGPSMAVLSQLYEHFGIAQVLGFVLMNVAAGAGLIVGAAAGGAIAELAGDATSYTLVAALSLGTMLALTNVAKTERAEQERAGADAVAFPEPRGAVSS